MATAGKKLPCSKCQKASSMMICRGCGQGFCYRHITDHRQELSQQMDELVISHDQFKQNITEQEIEPTCHSLIKRVEQWEQESIDKIRQAANDARTLLVDIINTYRPEVGNALADLTKELQNARREDDYVETDLQQWREKLNQLNSQFNAAQIIEFNPDGNDTALIPKYVINHGSTECFNQIDGDARIETDGKVLVHGLSNEFISVHCRNKYSFGKHRFSFRIERTDYGYFLCGLNSTSTPTDLIITSQQVYGAFGQTRQSPAIRSVNQKISCFFHSYNGELQSGCTYEVLIDCDKQIIQLTEKPGSRTWTRNIDLTKLPFPWQFFIILNGANDCVRLC